MILSTKTETFYAPDTGLPRGGGGGGGGEGGGGSLGVGIPTGIEFLNFLKCNFPTLGIELFCQSPPPNNSISKKLAELKQHYLEVNSLSDIN